MSLNRNTTNLTYSMKHFIILLIGFIFTLGCSKEEVIRTFETSTYYPPINNSTWETVSLEELNWDIQQIEPLLNFLEEKNTKGFIVLYNGRIVIEQYFNGHSASKPWYWASAGKTLTATITGIAEQNGIINTNNKVSDYLGEGWTSAPLIKENLITSKHLLSMSSGLDDSMGDGVLPSNLKYKADAGTRWAYHNVYVKLQEVIEKASKQPFSTYFNSNLRDKIGMTGSWIQTGDLSVYWSTTRSMARFGLLIANKGKWEDLRIVNQPFIEKSINSSQQINKSYGYLWWLNGKESFHLLQTQIEFNGSLIPSAPTEMVAALGKNDQKIYIVPSKKLVIIRMGEAADGTNFAVSNFDNTLWDKLKLVIK